MIFKALLQQKFEDESSDKKFETGCYFLSHMPRLSEYAFHYFQEYANHKTTYFPFTEGSMISGLENKLLYHLKTLLWGRIIFY